MYTFTPLKIIFKKRKKKSNKLLFIANIFLMIFVVGLTGYYLRNQYLETTRSKACAPATGLGGAGTDADGDQTCVDTTPDPIIPHVPGSGGGGGGKVGCIPRNCPPGTVPDWSNPTNSCAGFGQVCGNRVRKGGDRAACRALCEDDYDEEACAPGPKCKAGAIQVANCVPLITITPTPAPGTPTATPTEIIVASISPTQTGTPTPTGVAKLLETGMVKSFMYIIPAAIMLFGLIL